MRKQILNIGKTLSKVAQKQINGGDGSWANGSCSDPLISCPGSCYACEDNVSGSTYRCKNICFA